MLNVCIDHPSSAVEPPSSAECVLEPPSSAECVLEPPSSAVLRILYKLSPSSLSIHVHFIVVCICYNCVYCTYRTWE